MLVDFRNCILLIILFFGCLCHSANAQEIKRTTIIKPDDPAISYMGRINFFTPRAPVIYWPGTSIKTQFEGTSLAIRLNDQEGENYFNVIIDGDIIAPLVIACVKGDSAYLMATALPDTIHTLEIVKRTEGHEGPTTFLGFVLDEGKKLVPADIHYDLKMEFFGNSITSGAESSRFFGKRIEKRAEKNHYVSYAARTARALNAEYHCISLGGIGVMVSWGSLIMPELFYRLDPDDGNNTWDFASWTPDIVVINLFQNDSWLVNRPYEKEFKHRFPNGKPTEQEIIEAYKAFVTKIRNVYPKACIICALGSMNATKEGEPWPGYVKQAVNDLKEQGDKKLYTLIFPYCQIGPHPSALHHKTMAEQLTKFIKQNVLEE